MFPENMSLLKLFSVSLNFNAGGCFCVRIASVTGDNGFTL